MVVQQSVLAKPLHYEVNLPPKEELPGPFLVLSHIPQATAHLVTSGLIFFISPFIYKNCEIHFEKCCGTISNIFYVQ